MTLWKLLIHMGLLMKVFKNNAQHSLLRSYILRLNVGKEVYKNLTFRTKCLMVANQMAVAWNWDYPMPPNHPYWRFKRFAMR